MLSFILSFTLLLTFSFFAGQSKVYGLTCSFNISSSTFTTDSPIVIQVTPDPSNSLNPNPQLKLHTAVILRADGIQTGITSTQPITLPDEATITLDAPAEPGNYTLGVYHTSSSTSCGTQNITIIADVSDCEGLLGCTIGINVPGLKFTHPRTFIGDLISVILPIILSFVGFITVIVIVISGIQFMLSGGNPEAAAAARGRLTFAIIGFIIVILAFAITRIVDIIFLGGSGVF